MDADLREELMGEIDDVFGEAMRILPLTDGRRDRDREPLEIIAVLRTGDRRGQDIDARAGSVGRPGLMADGASLGINRAAWPDLVIRKGDNAVALERNGEPMFEVLSVDDRSHLRLICALGDCG